MSDTLLFIEQVKREFFDKEWSQKEGAIFLYSSQIIKNNIQLLQSNWQSGTHQSLVYYSMKANPNPHIIKEIFPLVNGFDVSSSNELKLLRKLNIEGKNITISGPAKTNKLMKLAHEMQVKAIHLDSYDEFCQWQKLNSKNEIIQKTLRVTLESSAKKLGICWVDIEKIFLSKPSTSINGIHVYLGRESFSSEALKSVLEITRNIKKKYSHSCSENFALYFGAGLPSASFFQEKKQLLLDQYKDWEFPVHIEAGRFIVHNVGVYLAKVLAVKELSSEHRLVIVNGGLQHLATNMTSPVYGLKNVHCEAIRINADQKKTKFQIYGSLGTRNDLIHPEAELPININRGDWIIFSPCGAYGYTAAANQFISPEPIREHLWNGKKWVNISPIDEVSYINSFGNISEDVNRDRQRDKHEI